MSKKLEDDFTPRLQTTVTGLRGTVHRILDNRVTYTFDGQTELSSAIRVVPSASQIAEAPAFATCAKSGTGAPIDAMGECAVSGMRVLRHLLVRSAASDRYALPEYMTVCGLSGKRVLSTEVEPSAVMGNLVLRSLLKISSLSGRKAEPEHFARCAFTNANALLPELAVSEVSGKRFRADQVRRQKSAERVIYRNSSHVASLGAFFWLAKPNSALSRVWRFSRAFSNSARRIPAAGCPLRVGSLLGQRPKSSQAVFRNEQPIKLALS